MADWTPPVIVEDFGRKARVVTQADVDCWLEMEARYSALVCGLRRVFRDARIEEFIGLQRGAQEGE